MSTNLYPRGPRVSRLDGFLLATRRRDILKFLIKVAGEYGDIAHFQIGSRRIFLLNHPDYIKDALTSHYESFVKGRQVRRTRHFLGDGLLTSEGEFHRRQRRLIQPAFHRQQFVAHASVIMEHGVHLRKRWQHDSRYFPDPSRFDPQRWTSELKATRPQYSYFPFGGGPRGCLGEGLAWIQGTLLIATIAQRWRVQAIPSPPVELHPLITLQPKRKIMLQLARRGQPTAQAY